MDPYKSNGLGRSPPVREDGLAQLSKIHRRMRVCSTRFVPGRSAENARRIKVVQDKFVNSQVGHFLRLSSGRFHRCSASKNLQKEGRALVGEGILLKVCRKKPKQRAFFLFNDILVYGRAVISGRRVKRRMTHLKFEDGRTDGLV